VKYLDLLSTEPILSIAALLLTAMICGFLYVVFTSITF
jgi:hypothetical protein